MFGQQAAVGANKQVCSFYLKGNCKYGARCWNLHPQNQGGTNLTNVFGGAASGSGGAGIFGQKPNNQQDTKDFAEFVKQVSGEMNQWERSGQWLLSSFAPLKSKPPISGFTDTSPEELRIQAYEAIKNNSTHTIQGQWDELQQRARQLREALKMSTPEATQALREVFHAKGTGEQQSQNPATNPSSVFGKPAGQSLFGGSSSQPSNSPGLLGATPQAPSLFGGSTTVFGGNQPSSTVFGGGANKSIFGGQASLGSQNTFNTQQQPSSTFGSGSSVFGNTSQNQPASAGIFGGSSTQNQSSTIFGGSASGQTNSGTMFAGTQTQNTQGSSGTMFAGTQTQNTQGSLFARSSQTQQSVFGGLGGNNQGSVFGSSQTPSVFGNTSKPATQTASQGSIFGGQQQGLLGHGPQQQGLLGQTPQQQGLLGQAPQQGLLGQVPQQQGLLGQSPQQQTSLFSKPATSTPSVFGGNTAPQNPSNSIFGNTAAQSSSSAFGNSVANPPVGGTTSSGTGLFGNTAAPNPPGLFGNMTSTGTPGLFGNPPETKSGLLPTPPASQMLPGMMGSPAVVQNTDPRGNKPEWYTPLDKLQAADRAQFEADVFTTLPLCPPPVELCF